MPSISPLSAGTAGNILLVEDYDALAAAIGSASRKFAPDFVIGVVRSLPEAESWLAERDARLLIVDFDPPHAEPVGFLERMRIHQPEMRVLVITAVGAPAVLRKRQRPAAFQFLVKPFELEEFGAVVKTLLGTAGFPSAAVGALGTLRDLNTADMIPLLALTGATIVLEVQRHDEHGGELHFVRGQLVHASAGGSSGIDAVEQMVAWETPRFVASAIRPNARGTIRTPWSEVLGRVLSR